ncbi:hypothetical protein F4819DRAFT_483669 [Hypoxylon fuscum]|nr:hypothetical protein F4819DRAFT_483669 [Hypoxylon fuscum]
MPYSLQHDRGIRSDNPIDDDRTRVDARVVRSRYSPGDSVYIRVGRGLQGPFLIEQSPQPKTYTLCDQDGNSINGGATFQESDLRKA